MNSGWICGCLTLAVWQLGGAVRHDEVGDSRVRAFDVSVDLSTRKLVVEVDGKPIRTFTAAVGAPEYRTPTGTYQLSKVIWNPKWVPPKAAWADGAEPKNPGERGNPMGRVKILFGP